MRIKLGGSHGKSWEFSDVKQIVIHAPFADKSYIGIDIEKEGGLIYKMGFSEAGTIRIDNKKTAHE